MATKHRLVCPPTPPREQKGTGPSSSSPPPPPNDNDDDEDKDDLDSISSSSMTDFPKIAYPAANDDFRAARNRCAAAVRIFNTTSDADSPALRAARWLDVVDPCRKRTLNLSKQRSSDAPACPLVKTPLYVDYGHRIYVGASTFVNRNFTVLDTPLADIRIGENCSIGPNVNIYAVSHPCYWKERLGIDPLPNFDLGKGQQTLDGRNGKGPSFADGVTIGNNVWVGGNVTIVGGVTIGDGAVIGAGSIVTRNVPAGYKFRGVSDKNLEKIEPMAREGLDLVCVGTFEEALSYDQDALKEALGCDERFNEYVRQTLQAVADSQTRIQAAAATPARRPVVSEDVGITWSPRLDQMDTEEPTDSAPLEHLNAAARAYLTPEKLSSLGEPSMTRGTDRPLGSCLRLTFLGVLVVVFGFVLAYKLDA